MLRIKKIKLTGFKNYGFLEQGFTGRMTGICGPNGRGKTNLLDAVHFCCLARSYFSGQDAACTRFGEEGFRIEAYFDRKGEEHKIVCVYRGTNRKELSLDDVPYNRFSEHIGAFPVVVIAPDDIELVNGGGEGRRKFMDVLLSQLDPSYLQQLIAYNKVLQQRNSLLKNQETHGQSLHTLLDVLDLQLLGPAQVLFEKRMTFARTAIPLIGKHYADIAGNEETVGISYVSQLTGADFAQLLRDQRPRDLAAQRTLTGIHRDDLLFTLNGSPFRTVASQGQRKSLLFAIRLTEYDMIREQKQFAPILLLDDVFEKLDEDRMNNLLRQVCLGYDGQVLITDTHCDRLTEALLSLDTSAQVIRL